MRTLLGPLIGVLVLAAWIAAADTSVPEGTTSEWTVDFVNAEGTPVIPETVTRSAQTVGDKEHPARSLIGPTPVPSPYATTITVTLPELTIPATLLNKRNPDLPDVDAVFVLRFCWAGGTKCRNAERAFPLANAPGWPTPAQ